MVANIVEGWSKRNSPADFKRHLIIAKGEAAECECWSELSADENLAERERCLALHREYGRLGMMLHNLWKEWRNLRGKESPSPPSHPAPPSPLR